MRVAAFQPPPLPGSIGLPVQFVLTTTDPFERLNDISQQFLQQARASGMFIFLDSDLKIDNPQTSIVIDRDKTAQLGLKMSDVVASTRAGKPYCGACTTSTSPTLARGMESHPITCRRKAAASARRSRRPPPSGCARS